MISLWSKTRSFNTADVIVRWWKYLSIIFFCVLLQNLEKNENNKKILKLTWMDRVDGANVNREMNTKTIWHTFLFAFRKISNDFDNFRGIHSIQSKWRENICVFVFGSLSASVQRYLKRPSEQKRKRESTTVLSTIWFWSQRENTTKNICVSLCSLFGNCVWLCVFIFIGIVNNFYSFRWEPKRVRENDVFVALLFKYRGKWFKNYNKVNLIAYLYLYILFRFFFVWKCEWIK